MKRNLLIFFLVCSELFANTILSNRLELGKQDGGSIEVVARTGALASSPRLRWNASLSRWETSADNSTFSAIPTDSGLDSSLEIENLSLSTSVAGNARTVSLKTKAVADPSASDVVKIPFRNATATTGDYVVRSVTSATSITIPSGTTLGTTNGTAYYIYVYALDNSGTVELALSLSAFDEGGTITTTAISGGSSVTTMYSTTARTSKAFRLIGRLNVTEATAGTWVTAASEVSVGSFYVPSRSQLQVTAPPASTTIRGPFTIISAIAGNGGSCGAPTNVVGNAFGGGTDLGAGNCGYTIASGTFSTTPTCFCTIRDSNVGRTCSVDSVSSTAVNTWQATTGTGGGAVDNNASIFCVGY